MGNPICKQIVGIIGENCVKIKGRKNGGEKPRGAKQKKPT
jgi:hypothetical protein